MFLFNYSLINISSSFDQHSKTFNSFTSPESNEILETSRTIIANTTEQLQNLTNELNQTTDFEDDEELCKALTRNGFKSESESYSPSSSPRLNSSRSSPTLEVNRHERGIDNNCDETDYNIPLALVEQHQPQPQPRDNNLSSLNMNNILQNIGNLENTSAETTRSTNPWHGSVTTSTDTLVPIRDSENMNGYCNGGNSINNSNNRPILNTSRSSSVASSTSSSSRQQNSILPEVHCSVNSRLVGVGLTDNFNCMEESIQIRPEHQKLEISSTGSYPSTTVCNNRRRRISSQSSTNSNKTADFVNLKAVNGG